MKPTISRRAFVKGTSAALAAGALVSGPNIFAAESERGLKGKVYPDQLRKYRDSRTGHKLLQMTDTPCRTSHAFYFTQAGTTPDGKWLFYGSDRAGPKGKLNLFKINLETGESIRRAGGRLARSRRKRRQPLRTRRQQVSSHSRCHTRAAERRASAVHRCRALAGR